MQVYVNIEYVPRYSLPMLKIFSARNCSLLLLYNITYIVVSALAVNIGMHPYSYEQGFREIQRKKMSQSFVERTQNISIQACTNATL